MRETVELCDLVPIMEEVINGGGTFRFYPRGISMQPLLVQGRDSVELGKAENVSVGDAVFYRRDSGQYVLHRIVGVHKGLYSMCGDNQCHAVEYGIRPEQILFKLVGYYKGGEYHSVEEPEYKKYVSERLGKIPFYYNNPVLHGILRKIKKLFK